MMSFLASLFIFIPLDISELSFTVPELKARIDAFLNERRSKNTNQLQPGMNVE